MQPKMIEERCKPHTFVVACAGRHEAIKRGTMHFDPVRGGWCSDDLPLRRMTPLVAYRMGFNTTGEQYLLDLCPYCGCEMPTIPPPAPEPDDAADGWKT